MLRLCFRVLRGAGDADDGSAHQRHDGLRGNESGE